MNDVVRFAASDEECERAYELRYKVYVEEMGRLGDKADHERRQLRDALDETARCIIAEQDGRMVGTMRIHWGGDAPFADALRDAYALDKFADILQDNQACIVERLMLLPEVRGNTALTSSLYIFLYRFVVQEDVEILLLDCEPHTMNNWLKLGFRPLAKTITYAGVGLAIPLVGVVWDVEHLKRIGSPLLLALGSGTVTAKSGAGQNARSSPLRNTVKQLLQRLPGWLKKAILPVLLLRKPKGAERHAELVGQILGRIQDSQFVVSEQLTGQKNVLAEVYQSLAGAERSLPMIFDDMSDAEVGKCLRNSNVIECSLGDLIIQEGNAARTLFILLSGVAEVRRDGELRAVLQVGAVFGEVAFLLGTPRTADVRAGTDGARILSLSESAIRSLMAKDERLAAKLLLNLCRCLCARLVD